MWLHIDAAWGGASLLSERLRARDMPGAELADSLAWNPHKMMNMPLTCSVFLTRHEGSLAEANSQRAEYLFQADKNNTEFDIGDRTIQCGRRADAFKLWLAWKAKGDAGFAAEVEHADALACALEAALRSRPHAFLVATPRSCTNVGFWYIPKRMRDWTQWHLLAQPTSGEEEAGGGGVTDLSSVPEEMVAELAGVAPKLKDLMQKSGDALIGFQQNGNLPNFFRCVIAGGKGLTAADLEAMLDRMDAMGEDL